MSLYVICPETITSPAPMQDWIPPNVPCGARCAITRPGQVIEVRCPRGHHFYATLEDILNDASPAETGLVPAQGSGLKSSTGQPNG